MHVSAGMRMLNAPYSLVIYNQYNHTSALLLLAIRLKPRQSPAKCRKSDEDVLVEQQYSFCANARKRGKICGKTGQQKRLTEPTNAANRLMAITIVVNRKAKMTMRSLVRSGQKIREENRSLGSSKDKDSSKEYRYRLEMCSISACSLYRRCRWRFVARSMDAFCLYFLGRIQTT